MTNKQIVRIEGTDFKDENGRTLFLRGINLAADSKLPTTPFIPSREPNNFFEGDTVSFVGRPFSIEDADKHLARIKSWGFNVIRYIFTWEALEHAGP